MTLADFVKEPLRGKTSLSRVFWLYGVFGSLVFSSFELFINPENQFLMRTYTILGFIFSVYVTVGIYRCANNSRSRWVARSARVVSRPAIRPRPIVAPTMNP